MGESRTLEAGTRFDDLLEIIRDGGEVLITRKGRGVARVIPLSANPSQTEAAAAVNRIRARAQSRNHPRIEVDEWRALRDEGRP
jgi:prevent-host-death family protein